MKIKRYLFCVFFIVMLASSLFAQTEIEKKGLEAITEQSIYGQLEFLASDWTEGRETGTKGIDMAADYIASIFKTFGLKPAGDIVTIRRDRNTPPVSEKTYFQNLELIEYKSKDDMFLKVHYKDGDLERTVVFDYRTDFSLFVQDLAEQFTAPVVFVGYGLTDKTNNYDDFADIDVKGKFILRLSGYPGSTDTTSNAYKIFHPDTRQKQTAMRNRKNAALRRSGAVGVLDVIYPDRSYRSWATNKPYRWNRPYYEGDTPAPRGNAKRLRMISDTFSSGMLYISISNRIADLLLKDSGIDIESFVKNAAENAVPSSKVLEDKKVTIKTSVETNIITTQNVLGYIEGENPDEVIVLGGHYDHYGKYNGYIWNGADDDASGTVGVMEIAKAFMATGVKPKKSVIFAAWTGEEKGLCGSRYFVNTYKPLEDVHFNMNFDMIGRDSYEDKEGNTVDVRYTTRAVNLKDYIDNYNNLINLNLNMRGSRRPRAGTDLTPFAEKDIPIVGFFTGFHDDYHQVSDTIDKINLEKMTKIIKLGFLNAWKVANVEGKLDWQ